VNPLPAKLGDIAKLYAHTKKLILQAEEIDPELKSSVAIIKELRDAFDHLMRYVADYFAVAPQGAPYQEAQLDKVVGHVFRASYDVLDSLSIALKLRLRSALMGKSHAAITTVFPAYYNQHIVKLSEIDERIVESRRRKDVGGHSPDHLEDYMEFLVGLKSICMEAESRVSEMVRYDLAQSKKSKGTVIIAVIGWVVAIALGIFAAFFKK
jgi:hypothetical protein